MKSKEIIFSISFGVFLSIAFILMAIFSGAVAPCHGNGNATIYLLMPAKLIYLLLDHGNYSRNDGLILILGFLSMIVVYSIASFLMVKMFVKIEKIFR